MSRTEGGAPENWRASVTIGGSLGRLGSNHQFSIEEISVQSGEFGFKFNAAYGMGYTVRARAFLSSGSWEVVERGEAVTTDRLVEVGVAFSEDPTTCFFQVSIP